MKPIRITYDKRGNTLSVRLSDKTEAYCRESDVGKEGERRPSKAIPVKTHILKAS